MKSWIRVAENQATRPNIRAFTVNQRPRILEVPRASFFVHSLLHVTISFVVVDFLSSDNKVILATAAVAIGASVAYMVSSSRSSSRSRPKGSSVENPVDGGRRYVIGGNWKCNGTVASNDELIKIFNKAGPIPSNVDVVICSTSIHLPQLLEKLRDDMAVGAQDCGRNAKGGAYTGEVCASQIKDLGCTWVIIGHSERREGFGMAGEPVEVCAEKAKVAIDAGLKVMFAIGEKKEEREGGTTMDVCASQLEPLAKILSVKDWDSIVIAYEPVWAIGTGLTATPEMAQETHSDIRKWIASNVSEDIAAKTSIQYGGSMKGANATQLLAMPDIDGGLIGGASLQADFFNVINGVPK
jgi:triosephosphate isomerase